MERWGGKDNNYYKLLWLVFIKIIFSFEKDLKIKAIQTFGISLLSIGSGQRVRPNKSYQYVSSLWARDGVTLKPATEMLEMLYQYHTST